jgi:anti-anti-sigma factor
VTDGSRAAAPLSIVTAQPEAGTVRVHLAGEVDLATSGQLRVALLAVVAAAAPSTHVRVDLAQVTFIDAGGIGVLIRARAAAHRAGVGFSVHNPRGIVRRVIDVLDLTDMLRVTPVRPASPSSQP